MKKVFLIIGLAALITSCSLNDDDAQRIEYELSPITAVSIPDTLVVGRRYAFPITSGQSECSLFYGFDSNAQDSTRFIGAVNRVVVDDITCDGEETQDSHDLNFEVLYNYTYVFKFYQGVDANDEPIYLTRNVPTKNQ